MTGTTSEAQQTRIRRAIALREEVVDRAMQMRQNFPIDAEVISSAPILFSKLVNETA
jgi:hypothetical protein